MLRQVALADLIPIRAKAVTWTSDLLHMRIKVEFKFALIGTSTILNVFITMLDRIHCISKLSHLKLISNRARYNQCHCGKQIEENVQTMHLCVMIG